MAPKNRKRPSRARDKARPSRARKSPTEPPPAQPAAVQAGVAAVQAAKVASDPAAQGETLGDDDRRYIPADATDRQVRRSVRAMLADGSLLRGLTTALEAEHQRQARDIPTPGVPAQADKRVEQLDRQRNMNMTPQEPPKVLRYQEFINQIDLETDLINALVAGLEDRTRFLQFEGPTVSETRAAAGGGSESSPGPSNQLESQLADRIGRLSLIRHRLEQLHHTLRI